MVKLFCGQRGWQILSRPLKTPVFRFHVSESECGFSPLNMAQECLHKCAPEGQQVFGLGKETTSRFTAKDRLPCLKRPSSILRSDWFALFLHCFCNTVYNSVLVSWICLAVMWWMLPCTHGASRNQRGKLYCVD